MSGLSGPEGTLHFTVRLNSSGQGEGLFMEREGDFGRHLNLAYTLSLLLPDCMTFHKFFTFDP